MTFLPVSTLYGPVKASIIAPKIGPRERPIPNTLLVVCKPSMISPLEGFNLFSLADRLTLASLQKGLVVLAFARSLFPDTAENGECIIVIATLHMSAASKSQPAGPAKTFATVLGKRRAAVRQTQDKVPAESLISSSNVMVVPMLLIQVGVGELIIRKNDSRFFAMCFLICSYRSAPRAKTSLCL
ncbi:hypothetical protein ES703_43966 [subsurface metagenome]